MQDKEVKTLKIKGEKELVISSVQAVRAKLRISKRRVPKRTMRDVEVLAPPLLLYPKPEVIRHLCDHQRMTVT